MNVILYLFLCVVADSLVAVADYLSKRWVLGDGLLYLLGAYGLFMMSTAAWFVFLKYNIDLGRSTLIWCASGVVVSLLIGHFCFNEVLTNLNKIGIVLSLIGVILCAIR